MKVYISGKIGEEVISESTRQKFAKAEEMLKANGYEVFNPCDEKWQATLRRDYEKEKLSPGSLLLQGKFPDFYAYALLRDMMVLSTKDAIYVLQDWERSPGSETEVRFAMATGKAFLCQKRQEAKSYLWDKWWDEEYDKFINDDDANGTCDDEVDRYINQHLEEIWLPL